MNNQPVKFENIVEDIPKEMSGIKPYLEEPEKVIKKAATTSILVSIFLAILIGGLIYFAVDRIKQETRKLQEMQNLSFLAEHESQNTEELKAKIKEIMPNKTKIEAALPSSNDLLVYFGALDILAKQAEVEQNVRFQTDSTSTRKPSNLPSQKVSAEPEGVEHTIELKGGLAKINAYINGLEKLPYFVKIININIVGSQGLNSEGAASLTLKIYTSEKAQ